jgi:hypothetical protein
MAEPTATPSAGPRATNAGPGRLLIGVYALFALSSGARAGVQIATRFSEAPVAYTLSALAAAIYLVAAIGLARGGPAGRRLALVCCTVELIGVLAVGTASLLWPDAFPDATVWSTYGIGYGFVPLVLPMLGLLWLRRTARGPAAGAARNPAGGVGAGAARNPAGGAGADAARNPAGGAGANTAREPAGGAGTNVAPDAVTDPPGRSAADG